MANGVSWYTAPIRFFEVLWRDVTARDNTSNVVESGVDAVTAGLLPIRVVTKTPDVLGHIFRAKLNHVNPSTITSQDRYIKLFENVANNGISNPNVLNPYQRTVVGFEGFSQTFRNGKQVWTQTFDGKVINAGVNLIPK